MKKLPITKIAGVIRSKNSGPYELTLDILFKTKRHYEYAKKSKSFCPAEFARLYKIPNKDIFGIIWFEPAHAVKITMRRYTVSGNFGDTDIYGAQQHAPLLGVLI